VEPMGYRPSKEIACDDNDAAPAGVDRFSHLASV